MRILVINAGSSSVKLRMVEEDDSASLSLDLPALDKDSDREALAARLRKLSGVDAIGHRIVHGGGRFKDSVKIDDEVVRELRLLVDLAPLHQPRSLAALEIASEVLPDSPAVACFDTAFHATMPPEASTYAIPEAWRERWGIRRYGFHGLSHSYASRRAADLLGRLPSSLRVVTCHLGAGASLAAVRDGVSIDTTMGFTPLEGLVMATRSGTFDPGAVLWLQERGRLSAAEVSAALEHDSGLFGLAGTSDMREIVAAADAGEANGKVAFDVYLHRLRTGIAAMTAALGGLDALVFTGGVGQNSPVVRARAAASLGFLGIAVDRLRNDTVNGDGDVTASGAAVRTLVVAAREDLEIARQVRRMLHVG
jgi:acetate kinase